MANKSDIVHSPTPADAILIDSEKLDPLLAWRVGTIVRNLNDMWSKRPRGSLLTSDGWIKSNTFPDLVRDLLTIPLNDDSKELFRLAGLSRNIKGKKQLFREGLSMHFNSIYAPKEQVDESQRFLGAIIGLIVSFDLPEIEFKVAKESGISVTGFLPDKLAK